MNSIYESPHRDRCVLSVWHPGVTGRGRGLLQAYTLAEFWPQLDVLYLMLTLRFQDNIGLSVELCAVT